jgi:hypothetical protein
MPVHASSVSHDATGHPGQPRRERRCGKAPRHAPAPGPAPPLLDQRLSRALYDQVEHAGAGQHSSNICTVGIGRDLHAGFRQSRLPEPGDQRRIDRCGTPYAFRAAAQDHRVARLQADAGGVGADVWAAFVDHPDHADRCGDALDTQTVRPRPVGERTGERIGQQRDVLQARCHGIDARFGQGEPVAEGGGSGAGSEVSGVGGQNVGRVRSQRCRHRMQCCVTLSVRRPRQNMRGGARGAGGSLQMLSGLGFDMHRRRFLWCKSVA